MAIQLIINREWGLAKNENPNQGAFKGPQPGADATHPELFANVSTFCPIREIGESADEKPIRRNATVLDSDRTQS